ncbi:MAG: hypothetical protein HFF09_01110 [Oscillospiraceae bacterium]|nr:hypothetical protein [Oscillospiraceae bacterium]
MDEKVYLNNEGEYGKYIIQTLQTPPNMYTPEFAKMYEAFSHRILWMDGNVVPGAFQMNTAWYYAVPERDPVFEEHVHDYDELIGFFGSDPENPYDLGAEMEVTINGERHLLNKSSLIFAPAGMPHMRISIKRVDRPMFHFSVVMNPEYKGGAYEK